jgi:RNA polymerase sigma factor (sigma-70 family)
MKALSEELMTDWAAVLAEHGPRVWRTAFRVLNHAADAHDCYQETFLAAWQISRTRRIDDWVPLLTCIATRKAIDRLRKRIRMLDRTEPLDAVAEPIAANDPATALRMAELLDRLRTGLSELPEKQAEVVWLSCVEGLSHQEIADQLHIPTGEVRVLLHRGRGRLCQGLASELTDAAE